MMDRDEHIRFGSAAGGPGPRAERATVCGGPAAAGVGVVVAHSGRPSPLASRITALYLAFAAVPLFVTAARGLLPGAGAILPVHVALVGVLAVSFRRQGRGWEAVGDLLPLALIPLLYAELPYLMAAFGAEFHDAAVQLWELAIFGGQPARTLAAALPSRWISEPLHGAYFSYYAMIYAPLSYLYARGNRDGFRQSAAAVMATFAICFAIFAIFPVEGPRYLWKPPDAMPNGPMRSIVLAVLERGSSRGAAFPSSHMAVAVAQSIMAIRWRVPGRWLIAIATLMLGLGAVYGGFHYAVDMVVGAAVGVLVAGGVIAGARR